MKSKGVFVYAFACFIVNNLWTKGLISDDEKATIDVKNKSSFL